MPPNVRTRRPAALGIRQGRRAAAAATLGAVSRTLRAAAALLLLLALVGAGCDTTADRENDTSDVDPVALARVLPTPDGLSDSPPPRAVGVRDLQVALAAGQEDEEGANRLDGLGLRRAAVREWSGPDGARLTVVISVWPDHTVANNVGAGAAELPLGSDGARAWTPREVAGSRGAVVSPPGPPSAGLAFAVGQTSILVRGEGPVGEETVVRTLTRLTRILRGEGEATVGGG